MQPKFSADEKVLCYHGPLLYEAKILKWKKEAGSFSYFVHYQVKANHLILYFRLDNWFLQGWNKNWDEWVGESRIMKQVPESYEKQKKLLQNHAAANKAQKKALKEAKKQKRGGSDSGANSRASTPVGDRISSGKMPKRSLADDERSNSCRFYLHKAHCWWQDYEGYDGYDGYDGADFLKVNSFEQEDFSG